MNARTLRCRLGRAALSLVLIWSGALAAQTVDRTALRPIPEVTLDDAEPTVREQIERQTRELETILNRSDLTTAQLADVYGATGQLYLLYDLAPAAEACLENAAQLAPDNFRWHYMLGSLYQLDGRLDLAVARLERTLQLSPGDGSSLMRLAEIFLRQERNQEAEEYARRAIQLRGFESAARFAIGRVALEREQPEQAVEHFLRALELQPQADVLHYHLGLAYRSLGDSEAMRSHFEQRGDNEVRYPDPLALELQGQATGVGAFLSLGRLSMAVGELDVAEERFRKAVELDPQSSAAHRTLASALQRKGQLTAALEEYDLAVRYEPDDAGLRYFVAKLRIDRFRSGEIAEEDRKDALAKAVGDLRATLEQAPDFSPAWLELAGVQELVGDPARAAMSLERVLVLDPSRHNLRIYRARMLHAAGDMEASRMELERLDQVGDLPQRDVYEAAKLRAELGDSGSAEASFRFLSERAEAEGVQALAHFQLGNLASGRDDDDAAIASYRLAIDLAPDMAEAHYNLATVLGRKDRFRESAEANRRATELKPDYHQARFAEAMALVLVEDFSSARKKLEEALELFPSQPGYAHLLARLLVASPDEAVRDGMVGLDLAMRLYQALPNPDSAETVAMAFAEVGRFDRAIEWQELLIGTLEEAGDEQRLVRARRHLNDYRALLPARSPWLE